MTETPKPPFSQEISDLVWGPHGMIPPATETSAPTPTEQELDDIHRAAQLWCLPQHSGKEMDAAFCESIAAEFARIRAEAEARGYLAARDAAAAACRKVEAKALEGVERCDEGSEDAQMYRCGAEGAHNCAVAVSALEPEQQRAIGSAPIKP